MAHFLEHLVFKGGEKYPTYSDVNETAERLGGVLNAYTSHDLVAFHITVRAESAAAAIDLLTRLRRAPAPRRRGARPRARRRDPGDQPRLRPALDRRRVPDRQRRVRRAPARAHRAGPRGEPAQLHARGDRRVPRAPLGGRARRRVPGRQPRAPARARTELHERFARFPALPEPEPYVPGARVRAADARRAARHQPVAPADDLPARGRRRRRARTRGAGDLLDAARRLDGLAPVRGDPREARAVLLGLRDQPRLRRRADPAARLGARVGQVRSRRTRACARSSTSCATRARPRRRWSARAPTPPAASCWPSRTRTRSPATRASSGSSSARTSTPTRRSPRSTRSPTTRCARSPRASPTAGRRVRRPAHSRGVLAPEPALELLERAPQSAAPDHLDAPTASPRRDRAPAPRPSLRCPPSPAGGRTSP